MPGSLQIKSITALSGSSSSMASSRSALGTPSSLARARMTFSVFFSSSARNVFSASALSSATCSPSSSRSLRYGRFPSKKKQPARSGASSFGSVAAILSTSKRISFCSRFGKRAVFKPARPNRVETKSFVNSFWLSHSSDMYNTVAGMLSPVSTTTWWR